MDLWGERCSLFFINDCCISVINMSGNQFFFSDWKTHAWPQSDLMLSDMERGTATLFFESLFKAMFKRTSYWNHLKFTFTFAWLQIIPYYPNIYPNYFNRLKQNSLVALIFCLTGSVFPFINICYNLDSVVVICFIFYRHVTNPLNVEWNVESKLDY